MLFSILKGYARLAIKVYCRKIVVNKPEWLKAKGPILFAANHPNSFLDGVILTTLMNEPVYSLARGDVFEVKGLKKWLYRLGLLPVYRTSEGVENLQQNYTTFSACQEVFRKGENVLIFSEGACVNEWHLRSLKKGTARLALSSWQQGIDLTVVPLGYNYNTFRNFGKNVFLNFGEPLKKDAILGEATEGRQLLQFNEQLRIQLEHLVYEIEPGDRKMLTERLSIATPVWQKVLLAPFALLGAVLHAPLYWPVKWFTEWKFTNDHFESVLIALLILLYPVYLIFLLILAHLLLPWSWVLALLVLAPFFAWSCVQVKRQV